MQRFLKIRHNITRCVYTAGSGLQNVSDFVERDMMDGEPINICPIEVVNVTLEKREVFKYKPDGKPIIKVIKTVDGQRTYIENLVKYFDRVAYRACIEFRFGEGEHIYGLGQDEDGILNKRGKIEYLYQHNMRIAMPMLISSKGYGVLFDCSSLMVFDDTGETTVVTLECVEQADFYVITGSLDEVVAGYRGLTGRAAPLPKWALGFMQSKERYYTQNELINVANAYRDMNVPIDVMIQDWKTWKDDLWGDKHLDQARFPDVAAMNRYLHNINIRTLISVWPNMNSGGSDHAQLAEKGMLLNDYSTYNSFDENARRVYWEQMENELYRGGFDGWWCDNTEPFTTPDWCGEVKKSERDRYELVGGEHEKYLDAAKVNLYGLMHAKGIYENQPNKPVVNLSRSGYAGIQKYGVILWAGDTSASWLELKREIAKGISISMCGIPYWTVDAGGFFVGGTECWRKWKGDPDAAPVWFWNGEYDLGIGDMAYQELYTRWMQFCAFLPIFRSHGTDTPREFWNYGDIFQGAIKQAIRLRYRLMPYIVEMVRRVTDEHYTIMRSLLFDFPDDSYSTVIDDEFMFGDSILVCPVTEPMYFDKGNIRIECAAKVKRCYLPKGTGWFDFWTNEYHEGGQYVEIDAPIGIIPLFVRAGSRIPVQEGMQYAEDNRAVSFIEYP